MNKLYKVYVMNPGGNYHTYVLVTAESKDVAEGMALEKCSPDATVGYSEFICMTPATVFHTV